MFVAIKVAIEVSKVCHFKMSRAVACRFFPRLSHNQIVLLVLVLILSSSTILRRVDANPLPDLTQEYQNLISEGSTVNSTDNSTDNSTEIAPNTDV